MGPCIVKNSDAVRFPQVQQAVLVTSCRSLGGVPLDHTIIAGKACMEVMGIPPTVERHASPCNTLAAPSRASTTRVSATTAMVSKNTVMMLQRHHRPAKRA
jgi:hypothetical protein